jgi:hypothetical protein
VPSGRFDKIVDVPPGKAKGRFQTELDQTPGKRKNVTIDDHIFTLTNYF